VKVGLKNFNYIFNPNLG